MPPATFTYEERYSRVVRWLKRLERGARSGVIRLTGGKPHILVEIKWRLGDEVMAIPIYEAIKKAYPKSYLTVWCTHPNLLENNPFVDAVNTEPHRVDIYRLLRRSARTEYRLSEYARAAGVPTPSSRPKLYFDDWTCRWTEDILGLRAVSRGVIALSAGASWSSKRWQLSRWQALRELVSRASYGTVQLGLDEPDMGAQLNLVGKTSLRDAACVLRDVDCFLGCDSGLMHLARAVETPTVALFGPTRPEILIRDDPDFHPIVAACACQGCWNGVAESAPGECASVQAACMETITVEQVADVLLRVLQQRRA